MESNVGRKSKVIAVLLYILLAPFGFGDLYLGYKDRFKKQILEVVGIILFIIFAIKFGSIFFIIAWIFGILVFIGQIKNYVNGFKILFNNTKVDASGNELL